MGNRLNYIDCLKVIGIFLVVWGHWYPEMSSIWIYAFHVPMFFMISGFLSKKEDSFSGFMVKLTKSLVVPYFLLSFIAMLPSMRMCIQHPDLLCVKLLGITLGFHTLWNVSCNGTMWFVYSLILIKIISQLSNRYMNVVLCLLSVIFAYWYNMESHENNWAVVNAVILYPFFVIGNVCREQIKGISTWVTGHRCYSAIIVMLMFVPSLWMVRNNGMVWVFQGGTGTNLALFYINALTLSFMLFVISCIVTIQRSWVRVISSGTIVILALHIILIGRMRPFIDGSLYLGTYGREVCEFCLSVLILMIFIPIIKITPIILLGGRKN